MIWPASDFCLLWCLASGLIFTFICLLSKYFFTFTIFHSVTCYFLPSPSVCVTMPDRIQGVWLGQIGQHELLRDEDGSWICRYCSFSFQRKTKERKTQASAAFWRFWLLFCGTFCSSCVWFSCLSCLFQVSSWPTTCSSWSSCATQRMTWLSTLTTLSPVWSDWRPCTVSATPLMSLKEQFAYFCTNGMACLWVAVMSDDSWQTTAY